LTSTNTQLSRVRELFTTQVFAGALLIIVFYGVLLTSAYLISQIDATAGLLMVPTCLWVTIAAALNWSIYFRTGGAKSD